MHYRRLGRSGLKVSEIALGTWVTFGDQISEQNASELVHAAYNAGVNFFDTADVYAEGRAEIVLGQAIRDLPRQTLVISSKAFSQTFPGPNGRGLSRKHIIEALHASLQRLRVDYLDIYFCQRFDPDTSIEEIVYTMDALIRQGKILYWGTSEWRAYQIAKAIKTAEQHHLIPPCVEQPQYSMFHRQRVEADLAPLCKEFELGLTTFSPLYHGLLTGKYNDGIPADARAKRADFGWMQERMTPDRLAIVQMLASVARDLGLTTAQLAIAWLLRRKDISSVITGATSLAQLAENLAAGDAAEKLDDIVLERIERILGNHPDEE
ncbi:MAG: aldo/keto reductase family protein [Anaerolineales bacterium]